MRVLIIVDKNGSAIDRLAQLVAKHNEHFDVRVLPVHPKRNDADTLYELSNLIKWCDVIDVHYWKSGEVAATSFPDDFQKKPKVLFHFNPYDAERKEINAKYDAVVVGNEEIQTKIPYARLVPYAVDLSFWTFNDNYQDNKIVNMCVNRIEGKKGVLEVALACKELGYKLSLVGRVSDGEYMQRILDTGMCEFLENATDEQMKAVYNLSTIHVCNSVDNFESGTLPILEAMACGLPVLTRNIGHVPDLYDGTNLSVRSGAQDNMDDLKTKLKEIMENAEWRDKLRQNGWQTVKNRNSEKMAIQVADIYWHLFSKTAPLVSVIIPTKEKPEIFTECLVAALAQNFPKYEIIVADSGVNESVENIVKEARKNTNVPIRYLHFWSPGYTLAEARNRAVVEARGKLLVFCDDRLAMDSKALSEFVMSHGTNTWVWGVKDDYPKGFVENFSCVSRGDFIRYGMCNERLAWYGGMTQELRTRFEGRNGVKFAMVETVKAKSIARARGKSHRRSDIVKSKLLVFKLHGA